MCIFDDKPFLKSAEPLLLDILVGKDKIDQLDLLGNNKIVKTDLKTADILNTFVNVAQSLDISTYKTYHNPVIDNVQDEALKAIL